MFVEQLRRAVEASPRAELPAVSALLWKAYAAGQVSEAEASALSEAIEARKARPAAGGIAASITRFSGETSALGRRWGSATCSGEPVHLGRASRPGRDRG